MTRKLHIDSSCGDECGCDCLTDRNHSTPPLYVEPKVFGAKLKAGVESDFDAEFIWQCWVRVAGGLWAGENGFIRPFSQLVSPELVIP